MRRERREFICRPSVGEGRKRVGPSRPSVWEGRKRVGVL